MTPDEEQHVRIYLGVVRWMKETLRVSDAFLSALRTDDDWTLIIKLHAMIEAALNQMLVTQFENTDLAKVIAHLETSNPKTGKLAFVKALSLLPDECMQFVRFLSEIRNLCVHNVHNFGFQLATHIEGFDKKKKKAWLDAILFGLAEVLKYPGGEVKTSDFVAKYPREGLHLATFNLIGLASAHELQCQLRAKEEMLIQLKAQRHDERHQSTPKE